MDEIRLREHAYGFDPHWRIAGRAQACKLLRLFEIISGTSFRCRVIRHRIVRVSRLPNVSDVWGHTGEIVWGQLGRPKEGRVKKVEVYGLSIGSESPDYVISPRLPAGCQYLFTSSSRSSPESEISTSWTTPNGPWSSSRLQKRGGGEDSEIEPMVFVMRGPLKGGFQWSGDIPQEHVGDPGSSEDSENDDQQQPSDKKRQKKRQVIEVDLTANMPRIQYMSFQLQLSEIDKAREIAKLALSTINFREEAEKLNVWNALMILGNVYGTEESLESVFKDAIANQKPFILDSLLFSRVREAREEQFKDVRKIRAMLQSLDAVRRTLPDAGRRKTSLEAPSSKSTESFWTDVIDAFRYRASHTFSYHCYDILPTLCNEGKWSPPRVASAAAAIQTQSDASVSPELVKASMHSQIHSPLLTLLSGSPKLVPREGTPSPPPAYLRPTRTRSSSDTPIELERPPASTRRTTLPESVLHHFVMRYTSPIDLVDIPPDDAP
ncbi:hypothetical protein BJY52DRAFT_1191744 [Lactarius psammicola]|nr:hypothetical protein BJY52DRAFT_1191744 [Lactarius psammicola]